MKHIYQNKNLQNPQGLLPVWKKRFSANSAFVPSSQQDLWITLYTRAHASVTCVCSTMRCREKVQLERGCSHWEAGAKRRDHLQVLVKFLGCMKTRKHNTLRVAEHVAWQIALTALSSIHRTVLTPESRISPTDLFAQDLNTRPTVNCWFLRGIFRIRTKRQGVFFSSEFPSDVQK